ncbi:MAG: tRNA-dihydrouridine synthase [Bdellovibrionaceae bacterium]|nr:tRNA-dihydrouridine synthase [Pseudobdellovibrionaceae bacterium]
MRILLAPMEGVVDPVLRDLLTSLGGLSHCATEFIRVTNQLLPPRVFYRFCPELLAGGTTSAGTPVYVQLLGGDPLWLARNAERAAQLGALGIDLNFGCPAKTVNRHDGGAALLKCPDRLERIVRAVRGAVPATIPVTAKIRLGYDSPDAAVDLARAVEAGGATWLSVHARTKVDGYRPPAQWEWIARIRKAVHLPVIANGDVWSREDYQRCCEVTGGADVMLGRGIIARPDLARQIRNGSLPLGWDDLLPLLKSFYSRSVEAKHEHHALCRTKQWSRLLGRNYPQATTLFERIKYQKTAENLFGPVYIPGGIGYPSSKENNYVYDQSATHSCRTGI